MKPRPADAFEEVEESEENIQGVALDDLLQRVAATAGTDTATLYALAPEALWRLILDGRWLDHAETLWAGAEGSADPKVMDQLVTEHGGAVFHTGSDGIFDVRVPDAVEEQGFQPPYGTQIEAGPHKTGIQWLVEMIFPSFLQGLIGRWLLTKLFDTLKNTGVLPTRFFKWLHKRMPLKALKRTASVYPLLSDALSDTVAVENALAQIQADAETPEQRAAWQHLVFFLERLGSLPTPEAVVAPTAAQVLAYYGYSRVAARRHVRSPTKNKPPRGITNAALPVWEEVIEQFKAEIKGLGHGDRLREWSAAILIFQRVCHDRDIEPWRPGVAPLGSSPAVADSRRKQLVKRLLKMDRYGVVKLTKLEEKLSNEFELETPEGFEYTPPVYDRSRDEYQIRFLSSFEVPADRATRAALKDRLLKLGFTRGSRKFFYSGKHGYRLTFQQQRSEAVLALVIPLTRGDAMLLARERHPDKLDAKLAQVAKRWFNTNSLT